MSFETTVLEKLDALNMRIEFLEKTQVRILEELSLIKRMLAEEFEKERKTQLEILKKIDTNDTALTEILNALIDLNTSAVTKISKIIPYLNETQIKTVKQIYSKLDLIQKTLADTKNATVEEIGKKIDKTFDEFGSELVDVLTDLNNNIVDSIKAVDANEENRYQALARVVQANNNWGVHNGKNTDKIIEQLKLINKSMLDMYRNTLGYLGDIKEVSEMTRKSYNNW